MGQEFFIKSDTLEDKVRQILPSQGGLGQNFDLSASTQIVPIVDLTESAEGSNFRQDLQTAFSYTNTNPFEISTVRTTIINNTGYFRILGTFGGSTDAVPDRTGTIFITDGVTDKILQKFILQGSGDQNVVVNNFDFMVFCAAGIQVDMITSNANVVFAGSTRQIADIDGNLINP
jgi:hypothetical protein